MKKTLLISLSAVFALTATAQPGGSSGGGTPGGSSSGGSSSYTFTASSTGYYQSSGNNTVSGQTYSSTGSDENAVLIEGGTFTGSDLTITKTGDTSQSDMDVTSFYGINSAVLVKKTGTTATISGGTITTNAKGANAVICTDTATLYISDVVINCSTAVSRGIHCTYQGTIYATNCTVTTQSETSSAIATDRGGGTVVVDGGTYTANGRKCAIIYCTGDMTVKNATGYSNNTDEGEICDIEGDNTVTIDNCNLQCSGNNRGVMLYQSGSGDATGYNPTLNISNSTLTLTSSSAPFCEVSTAVNAYLNLDNCTLTVPSGQLAYINTNTSWNNSNTKYLQLSLSNGTYYGSVDADETGTTKVIVNSGATWEGSIDNGQNMSKDTVVVNGTWILDKASYPCQLIINSGATVYTNGYTLDCCNITNNGTLDTESTGVSAGINAVEAQKKNASLKTYNLAGQVVKQTDKGVVIRNGKKFICE